jgi:two-component system sensor histidine kinase RegB
VGASIALNLALRWRYPLAQRLDDAAATTLLAYDILQLACLLYFTGGISNPFSVLFLAPVTIAATSLSLRHTIGLVGFALVSATALAFSGAPQSWIGGAILQFPKPYIFGLWTGLAVSMVFVAIYAFRVAREARQLADALAATELVLARAQHLSQLDGLAAAAAHELGTPLATVALVVHEMAAEPPPNDHFDDDLKLLDESVARCRTILSKLGPPSTLAPEHMEISNPDELIELAAAPHRLLDVAIAVEADGPGPAPHCPRNAGVLYGLGALIENAVSFAKAEVRIRASWTKTLVRIVIADDGPGFPPHVLARLGEPYLSARTAVKRGEQTGGGLGLGLFIASALLERSGARLELSNETGPGEGAMVAIVWPRAIYEHGRRDVE